MSECIKIKYQSPDTDIPNEVLISNPLDIKYLIFEDEEIIFQDGGYLSIKDMDSKDIQILTSTKFVDSCFNEIWEDDVLKVLNLTTDTLSIARVVKIKNIFFLETKESIIEFNDIKLFDRYIVNIIGNYSLNPELLKS